MSQYLLHNLPHLYGCQPDSWVHPSHEGGQLSLHLVGMLQVLLANRCPNAAGLVVVATEQTSGMPIRVICHIYQDLLPDVCPAEACPKHENGLRP